ncbi:MULTISPECIES: GNAT family N-acetyltransferase [Bacillus]|uniref:GNAT family N-acetyltransferase n=1 Tax=Bacillus TaxID=1386 RepID=UPI000BFA9D9D|nr:GNAT family N-acetyltransferase [Bacillus safensis]PGC65668.1 GNAT family N-acetyltransferase [Bacillus safensis]
MGCLFIFRNKILIKIFFQDKIGSIHHSFGGGFLNIRLLTPDDAEEYAALRLEALRLNPEGFAMSYEEEQINTKDKYKARFASAQSMWTFGAFHQGQLVGAVTLIQETLQKLKHRANLTAMYVTPSARGEGAGQALMTKALSFARERQDIEQMYLSVVTTNHSAKRLYRSVGFESYAVEEKALKWADTYADEEKMVLFLS